jgi:hypothetical protein
MRFEVYNAKAVPMAITEIGYTITMNNVTVGNGTSQSGHVIEGHTTETIETRTAIRNQRLDAWWVSHLENGQVTDLRIDFYAKIEVAGETFRVPLDQMTYTKTIETDIFGNKAESGEPTEASGSETTAEDGETTASDDDTRTAGEDGGTAEGTTTSGDGTVIPGGPTTDGETTTDDGESPTESGNGTTTDDGLLALDAPTAR